MRKYFLLSTVALATMVASESKADDIVDFDVSAKIKHAVTTETVTPLSFGTIIVDTKKSGVATVTLTPKSGSYDGSADISATGGIVNISDNMRNLDSSVPCLEDYNDYWTRNMPTTLTLTGADTGETLTVSDFTTTGLQGTGYCVGATLTIPDTATVKEDDYSASITVYNYL